MTNTPVISIQVHQWPGLEKFRAFGPTGIGPWFEDRNKAVRVACAVCRALRQEGVPIVPAIVIPDAAALHEAVQCEIDMATDAFNDDPYDQFDLSTEQSLKLEPDGSMVLDYEQACVVSDMLPRALETAEDMEDSLDPVQLRRYVRLLDQAGFEFVYTGVPDFRIRLAPEDADEPYIIEFPPGEPVGTAPTLADAYRTYESLRGPLPGTQIQLPLEEAQNG